MTTRATHSTPSDGGPLWTALAAQRERAVRVALARGAEPQDVDDIVHEAMARVAAMPRVDLERVGPLLTTVVSNLVVDGHRRKTTADRALRRLQAERAILPPSDDDICDPAEARWLDKQIPSLPAQDGHVLRLRAQGLTRQQAAAALGISNKAAEGAFTRARNQMQAIWRTTAACVGIGWARQLRGWRAAAPAAAAAALATAAALHHTPHPLTATPATVPPPAAAFGPNPQERAGPMLRPVAPAPATPRAARAATSDPKAAAPARATTNSRTVMSTPPLGGTAGLTGGAVAVEQRDPDQTLTQSVQQCIDNGVTVTPYKIGC